MAPTAPLRFGRFSLDPARRVLMDGERPARLGSRAIDVLIVLAANADRVVSKAELLDRVWPGLVVEENNLQQHISALRKLLGAEAIVTVPGRGYKFALRPQAGWPTVPTAAASPAIAGTPSTGPLIGRDEDLAQLRARVVEHDLVTLVGPGGVGKTRLAAAAARDLGATFDGNVWIVDLAVVDADGRVAGTVAQTLDIVLPPDGRPETAIAGALRRQHLLLVLDNCEHVVEGVARLVGALRQVAYRVHVLATSQEPLRLPGEQLVRLAPLPGAAAVELFLARAKAADWRFEPRHEDLDEIAAICERLDGLPLALELAAARLPLLGVQGLRRRLDDGLRVLGTGASRAAMRHQTLRAALDWSHGLLQPREQVLFRRLAVFSGGFSPDLAERVLTSDEQEPWEMLDGLATLVDKSLILSDARPLTRCRLLEPARAYALEHLRAAGEEHAMRLRHARALADRLQEMDRAMAHEPRCDRVLAPLLAEADNVRAAMRWLADAGSTSTHDASEMRTARHLAIALAAHADWLWTEGDLHGEGFRFCALAREWLDDGVPQALACRLRLAYQAQARSRWMPAGTWIADARAALDGFRAVGDAIGLYRALCALARGPRSAIDHETAGACLAEAEAVERADWSPRLRMYRQMALEWWTDLGGDLEACRDAGRRCLALAREAGSIRGEIGALGNLADTAIALGRHDEAIALGREAIALAEAHGTPGAALHVYSNIVPALLSGGDLDGVRRTIAAGREVMVRTIGTAIELLLPAALLSLREGHPHRAACLLGCADHAYAERGEEPHPPERRMRAALVEALGAALSGQDVERLRRAGAQWEEDRGFEEAGFR